MNKSDIIQDSFPSLYNPGTFKNNQSQFKAKPPTDSCQIIVKAKRKILICQCHIYAMNLRRTFSPQYLHLLFIS